MPAGFGDAALREAGLQETNEPPSALSEALRGAARVPAGAQGSGGRQRNA